MKKHILIVDDDAAIGDVLEEILMKEGYAVLRAYSGTEALYVLSQAKLDLVLLDLMLPGLDGEKVLAYFKGIPVIVISAKVDVDSKVDLLLGGAADYVTKPFSFKELLARIAVQLRAPAYLKKDSLLIFDDIQMDIKKHTVVVGTSLIKLTRTEYALLKLLMQNPSQVLTKSQLLEQMSEDSPDGTESSLKTHMSHLRTKLRKPKGKEYIEAVWGIGFKMKEQS